MQMRRPKRIAHLSRRVFRFDAKNSQRTGRAALRRTLNYNPSFAPEMIIVRMTKQRSSQNEAAGYADPFQAECWMGKN